MKVNGYDPGLSIDSALKLPRDIGLADSITGAVAGADYISINIPYIKGENGTHHIIGADIINHFKKDAVLLNFARGELVDSNAMKNFLDNGDGRYISDFPDDELWNHKNAVILPHLGASTEEAEDQAVSLLLPHRCLLLFCLTLNQVYLILCPFFFYQASMAADTIRDYLENGTIKNSVNFPSTALPDRPANTIRFTVVNRNEPGLLAKITESIGKYKFNIVQQINQSRGKIAYNVIDVDPGEDVINLREVQKEITLSDGVLSSRVLFGVPGAGYAKNVDGEYYI